jgi:hypothetical protein
MDNFLVQGYHSPLHRPVKNKENMVSKEMQFVGYRKSGNEDNKNVFKKHRAPFLLCFFPHFIPVVSPEKVSCGIVR